MMEMDRIFCRSSAGSQPTLCISLYYRWILTASHIMRLKFDWPESRLWPNNFTAFGNFCCYYIYYNHYCNHWHRYIFILIFFLATTAKSHPLLKPSTLISHDSGLHMAVDVVNDQQLMPVPSNSRSTNVLTYADNNNFDDKSDSDKLNDMQRYHRAVRIIRRKKRFAAAQTSRWDKMTSDNVLKLKWFISRYTRDMPRSEIRSVIRKSFAMWSTQTIINSMPSVKLQFDEAAYEGDADIVILWAEGDHGDAYKFDGTGNHTNILAHTFYPTYQEDGHLNGDIHLGYNFSLSTKYCYTT